MPKVQKGEVRNPHGRPVGSKNKNLVMEELQKHGFNLIEAMVHVAMNDPNPERQDKNRFKLLDRIAPALKMIDHTFDKDSNLSINFSFSPKPLSDRDKLPS